MKQTLYQILGVDPKASPEEISAAYARQFSEATSASSQDPTRLPMLRQANEILSDPVQRVAYDRSLAGGGLRRPTTSYNDLEPTFLQSWGKWISAPDSASRAGESAAAARSAEGVFADVSCSVARVNVMDGSGRTIAVGSGVVIDHEIVLTNCHLAKRGSALAVRFTDGTRSASIELADESLDLCRLSVPGLKAPPVAIGNEVNHGEP